MSFRWRPAVRNLVAHYAVHVRRIAGIGLTTAAVLLGSSQAASAAQAEPAAGATMQGMPLGLDGVVGMIAVGLGVAGLIFGLVRHRRGTGSRVQPEGNRRRKLGDTLELE